jgi:hypothetical protein
MLSPLTLTIAALTFSAGVMGSGAALAEADKFDGAWSVQMVASAGMCGSSADHALIVQESRVRASSSGVSVSGQVGSTGSVSLTLQKGPAQGTATGKLSGSSGAGTWTVAGLGCSGRWTAQRQTLTARAF